MAAERAGIGSVVAFLPASLLLAGLADEKNTYTGLSDALDLPVAMLLVLGAVFGTVGAMTGSRRAQDDSRTAPTSPGS